MQPIRPIFRDRSPQCSTSGSTWEAIPGFRCAKVGSLGDTAPGSLGSLPLGTWPPQGDPGGIKTYGKPMGKHMENMSIYVERGIGFWKRPKRQNMNIMNIGKLYTTI